ncbi:hypothetical protein I551_8879 [Mycobacterium ulcerans str. Harvey]|uniref:Uncharacterized protein n=1 Tax=Mycobacterium ulcerans str. Harvey TaxID=1299332 RepID=A0ABN0R9N4_MYCUL|nr:hypothetical protein I551_8879 [Mycobacterium ulcerans str. Harvey]
MRRGCVKLRGYRLVDLIVKLGAQNAFAKLPRVFRKIRGGRRDDHQNMRKVIIDERPTIRSTTIL